MIESKIYLSSSIWCECVLDAELNVISVRTLLNFCILLGISTKGSGSLDGTRGGFYKHGFIVCVGIGEVIGVKVLLRDSELTLSLTQGCLG
jgi:hypothetical protein